MAVLAEDRLLHVYKFNETEKGQDLNFKSLFEMPLI